MQTRIICQACGVYWDTSSADPQEDAYREFFRTITNQRRPDGCGFIQGICDTCSSRSLYPPRQEQNL